MLCGAGASEGIGLRDGGSPGELVVSERNNELLELRGRLSAVTACVESATAHVLADLKGPDHAPPAPPARPSGETVAAEVAAVVRALTRDIRSAAADKPGDLDHRGIFAAALEHTVSQIEGALRALDLGGGSAGDLASALRDLLAA